MSLTVSRQHCGPQNTFSVLSIPFVHFATHIICTLESEISTENTTFDRLISADQTDKENGGLKKSWEIRVLYYCQK